ncbi:hypothetical protein Hanom_Chr00s007565g01738191 [Helianthus anomalus]
MPGSIYFGGSIAIHGSNQNVTLSFITEYYINPNFVLNQNIILVGKVALSLINVTCYSYVICRLE